MLSLSDNNQADVVETFNSTSRYLDDLLNIDNPYFEQMVSQIYPTELHFNKANFSDTEKVSEYDQEIPQSHSADQPTANWHPLFRFGLVHY